MSSAAQATPWTAARRLPCPWDCSGKNAAVGRHLLLHSVFPTQVARDKYWEDYLLVKKDIHTL